MLDETCIIMYPMKKKNYIHIYSLGLQIPSQPVFGVGLEGPNTF